MEIAKIVTLIGIVLNIIGFLILLSYGLPTKYVDKRYKRDKPVSIFNERDIASEIHKGHRDRYNENVKLNAHWGIGLNILGLILQAIAIFL